MTAVALDTTIVAYPGPHGSHTAAAAAALFPAAERTPLATFRAVAEAVVAGEVAYGVLPIESSLAGAVAETHDLLYELDLSIVAETVRPIRHCLLGFGALEDVRVVRSHPAAFDQCRRVVEGRKPIPAATTSDAARLVAEHRDVAEAALASREAAEEHRLPVIADDVGDHPAFTRFVTVAAHTRVDVDPAEARMALSFVTDHRPGALHRAITPFVEAGLDLQRLVSRPLPESPFQYRFDAVVVGHPLDSAVRDALRSVTAVTRELHVLGVYAAHEQEDE
jgi:prephenate dehydratase